MVRRRASAGIGGIEQPRPPRPPAAASCLDEAGRLPGTGGIRLPMRQRQIVFRPHLDQPRDGPVEFESLPSGIGLIEVGRFRLGRGEEFDARVVERIDEGDEPLGLVAPLEGEPRECPRR